MARRLLRLPAVALTVALVASCSVRGDEDRRDADPIAGARLGGDAPGSLVTAVTMPGLDPSLAGAGIRAALITYRSTDATTGESTVVSGTAFVPDRPAPPEGWRVIALGHGSTGITEDCEPSDHRTLAGQLPLVMRLVSLGLVVTMTDYQGLGAPGVHRYLDSPTAGRNVIDSVRAARSLFSGVTNRWAAIGGSQGGGAVWSADEQASSYAPDLDLVGVVALAPATDVTGLVDKAVAGTLTTDQRPTFQWLLASLGNQHPDLDLDHYRRGVAAAEWDLLASCADADEKARATIGPDDLRPDSPAAAARIKEYLAPWSLPRQRLSAPLFVAYGEKDTFVDPAWTTRALTKACRLGGVIQWRLDPNGTHLSTDAGDPVQWLADRFAGTPATSDCPTA